MTSSPTASGDLRSGSAAGRCTTWAPACSCTATSRSRSCSARPPTSPEGGRSPGRGQSRLRQQASHLGPGLGGGSLAQSSQPVPDRGPEEVLGVQGPAASQHLVGDVLRIGDDVGLDQLVVRRRERGRVSCPGGRSPPCRWAWCPARGTPGRGGGSAGRRGSCTRPRPTRRATARPAGRATPRPEPAAACRRGRSRDAGCAWRSVLMKSRSAYSARCMPSMNARSNAEPPKCSNAPAEAKNSSLVARTSCRSQCSSRRIRKNGSTPIERVRERVRLVPVLTPISRYVRGARRSCSCSSSSWRRTAPNVSPAVRPVRPLLVSTEPSVLRRIRAVLVPVRSRVLPHRDVVRRRRGAGRQRGRCAAAGALRPGTGAGERHPRGDREPAHPRCGGTTSCCRSATRCTSRRSARG